MTRVLLVAALLLLGAFMMAALGMLAGSMGKDFMSTMFIAIALIVPMAIPTFTILFPGSTSLAVQLLPSYGFVEAMVGLMGHGLSAGDVAGHIALTAGWTVLLFLIALWRLKRRMEAL